MKSNINKSTVNLLTTVAGVVLTTGLTVDGSANPVQAAQFNYSYSGEGIEASGVLTTTNSSDANGYLTITGIKGQRNGETITALLPPGSFPIAAPNDNLFSPTKPFLNFNGFSYLVGAKSENVFYFEDKGRYGETDDPNIATNPANARLLNKFNVQAVSEPSNVGGLIVVLLGGIWLLKKKSATSAKHELAEKAGFY
ncbi:MAG: PEP-CTERM sorting domain-containing protein [Nostoc sp.]|uniref:PEP-CTERM sorting domain-containing protein n=1 Tax=Nostoc sp. TaxID=1180 RepID=UPI002FF0396E